MMNEMLRLRSKYRHPTNIESELAEGVPARYSDKNYG